MKYRCTVAIPRRETLDLGKVCNGVTNGLNDFSLCHHVLMKLLQIINDITKQEKHNIYLHSQWSFLIV